MARYKSKAISMEDFKSRMHTKNRAALSAYYTYNDRLITREDGLPNKAKVISNESEVHHNEKSHPNFGRWEDIPNVIENGQAYHMGKGVGTGGEAYAFVINEGEKSIIVVADLLHSRELGFHIIHKTSWVDSTRSIENYIAKYQKGTVGSQASGGSPAYPSPPKGDVHTGHPNGPVSSLSDSAPPVKPGESTRDRQWAERR